MMTFDEAHPTTELVVDRRMAERRQPALASVASNNVAANNTDANNTDATEDEAENAEGTFGERRKVERRRQIDPTTCERDYNEREVEFMNAMNLYKRRSGRQFPTWSEVLEVIHSLGYRQVAEYTEIEL